MTTVDERTILTKAIVDYQLGKLMAFNDSPAFDRLSLAERGLIVWKITSLKSYSMALGICVEKIMEAYRA